MKTLSLSIVVCSLYVISCGPSQKDIERQQFVADSLKVAKEDSLKRIAEEKEQLRIHEEKIEVGKSIKKNFLEGILDQLKQELETEKAKLKRINEFQIGRSLSTKNNQILEQNVKISKIETNISSIEREISYTQLFESFDFQKSPEGTVKYIFSAAKSGDLSKMRHLMDPYGEFNKGIAEICFIEISPDEGKKKWKNFFANGRIMGSPQVKGDLATIEIAVGNSSDRLKSFTLVKRLNRWYLLRM